MSKYAAEPGEDIQQPFGQHLGLMIEMAQDFAASRDIDATLRHGLTRIAAVVGAEAASAFLLDEEADELVCQACHGPVDITGLRLPAGQGIVGRTVATNKTRLVRDVDSDPDFGAIVDESTGFRTRSILCAPMSVHGARIGAIELINKQGGGLFGPGDGDLLAALASSAALAIINARMAAAMAEQEAVKRELELAAEIQRGMLPRDTGGHLPLWGLNLPARGVSGDFYDIVALPGRRVAFSIGDVSGKGINASLLMAKTSSLFRCLAKTIDSPAELLSRINAELCETGTTGVFVTMAAGFLDLETNRIVLANAGHEPPLQRRSDGDFRAYEAEAPPLGIGADLIDRETLPEVTLDRREGCLYLFTDGLTECRGADGNMIGGEGVRDLIRRYERVEPPGRLQAMVETLAPAGAGLRDDLTLLMVGDR